MSAVVRLSSKLPGDDETNGVDPIVAHLLDKPEAFHVAVVWFDVSKVTIDTDNGWHIPTLRVRRIEPLPDGTAGPVTKAAEKAFSARTGRAMLPLEDLDQPTLDDES